MKTFLKLALASAVLFCAQAQANQADFCAGFAEGYKTIKGDRALLPLCPLAPLTPLGSSDYREGVKAGIRAAGGRA